MIVQCHLNLQIGIKDLRLLIIQMEVRQSLKIMIKGPILKKNLQHQKIKKLKELTFHLIIEFKKGKRQNHNLQIDNISSQIEISSCYQK